MTYYATGAAACFRLGRHYRPTWSSACARCGAELTQAEREEADDIREALYELQREEWEAADLCGDVERDVRSHEVET